MARHVEVTHQSIIQAARKLFVAHGYRAAIMRAIAAEAGAAERTVHSTFAPNKISSPPSVEPDQIEESAVALFLALRSATVYRELVEQAAWSLDRFEAWLAEILAQQLLTANSQQD